MGLIGACWASMTSLIGSGWLFGSWKGAYSTGTSSILAWVIAGIAIIILALIHAELGGMYPVAGGTARFPHFAIIILFTHFHGANFNSHGGFFPEGSKAMFAAIPGAGIVFAYLGFEQADQLAGEVKNPQRNLPRAIILAILMATVIYVLLQVVFIGAIQPSALTHGWGALQNNAAIEVGPLAFIAGAAGLGWWATILRVDAVISPSGTGLIYQTSTSRVGYGLARNRYYPPFFGLVDKRGVPWVSLILSFVLGLVFLLPFPSWSALVGLVTSASVLMYAGAPLSLGALRKQVPDANRPYRVPGAEVLAPLAFAIASLIIYFSGFETIWKLGIVLVIGYILIGAWMIYDKNRPPMDWRAASWLPVYLIGMGIISWQGQFGPDNTNRIPFGWDILIVAVFSIAIYYWARAVRAPREEVLELVARQSAEPEPTLPAGH